MDFFKQWIIITSQSEDISHSHCLGLEFCGIFDYIIYIYIYVFNNI